MSHRSVVVGKEVTVKVVFVVGGERVCTSRWTEHKAPPAVEERNCSLCVSTDSGLHVGVFFFPDLVLLIERNPTALVHSHSFTQNVPNVSNHLLKLTVAKSLRSYFRS